MSQQRVRNNQQQVVKIKYTLKGKPEESWYDAFYFNHDEAINQLRSDLSDFGTITVLSVTTETIDYRPTEIRHR